jgi:hypothetical protein
MASEDHARQEIPRNNRSVSQSHRHFDVGAARSDCKATDWMRRRITLFEALAMPSASTPTRQEALEPIRLEPWHEVLVKEATEEFVRGLIDSDGCRVVANDRGVRSARYHFSNRSDDIRGLFCSTLDEPGIPWTRPRWFEVAVYRKAAVARLDEFVGPKA